MQIVIVEDEKPASQRLVRLLRDTDDEIIIKVVLESVEATVNWLAENDEPDLIFMDIQLEDGICFEIFQNSNIRSPVIFTTAFDEYSLRAFKVNSIDYLLKPVNKDELDFAIQKFKSFHQKENYQRSINKLIDQIGSERKQRFLVKIGDRYQSVRVKDIICFYIEQRCNFIFTAEGKNYAIDLSLDKIESLVDPMKFFRINRNMIINIDAVNDVISYSSSRLKIQLLNWRYEESIFVSRHRVAEFKRWLDR